MDDSMDRPSKSQGLPIPENKQVLYNYFNDLLDRYTQERDAFVVEAQDYEDMNSRRLNDVSGRIEMVRSGLQSLDKAEVNTSCDPAPGRY